jgi:hypothetical protein
MVLAAVVAIIGLLFAAPVFAAPKDNVLSANIKEADGTTGQDTETGSGIKTGHIQDGRDGREDNGTYLRFKD